VTEVPEVWHQIPGYEGWYEASTYGRIRRRDNDVPGKVLRGVLMKKKGRLKVTLSVNNTRKDHFVHSLVAAAFLGSKPPQLEVNHIDGDKLNNASFNLEYVTRKQNREHASKNELYACVKLTKEKVVEILDCYGTVSNLALAERYGVAPCTICNIGRGRVWKWVHEEWLGRAA
jgi:HNH endonuclease/NUMOD4 motif